MNTQVEINYNNCKMNMMVYNFHETISSVIKTTRTFFEIDFLSWISKHYPNHKGIVDIGANIGNHTIFFAKFLNSEQVYAFEPYPANFSTLAQNISLNHLNVLAYEIALSDKEGEMILYNSQSDNFGGFSLHNYSNGSSFVVKNSVPVKTLDSYNLNDITMIKIDVENHENEVLEGAKETILRNKPIIFVENLYHGYPNVCPNPHPHKKILESFGYKCIERNILGGYMDLWIPS